MERQWYGKIGTSKQIKCISRFAPEGAVIMNEQRPSLEHIAQANGTWIENSELLAKKIEQEAKVLEKETGQFANLTMEQAETWINNNVTDLPSAKIAMKKIVKLILART